MATTSSGNGAQAWASTKGVVDQTYQDRLNDLKTQAAAQFTNYQQQGVRPWQHPTGFTGDILNIPELAIEQYGREALNQNYLNCMKDPQAAGTVGDVIAIKSQIDYLACQERAYRHRHASLARCMAHAMARRNGQGNGPLFSMIQGEVAQAIQTGGQKNGS